MTTTGTWATIAPISTQGEDQVTFLLLIKDAGYPYAPVDGLSSYLGRGINAVVQRENEAENLHPDYGVSRISAETGRYGWRMGKDG